MYECNRYIRKKISKEDMDIKRIQEFKGKYKGQRCFVVATGPSLTVEDLNTLHKNNEVVFSMNTIVNAFEKTEFRPTFYCIQDKEVYLKNKDKICCYQLPYILIGRANVPLKRVRIEKKELPIDKNVYMYRLNAIYHWTQVVYGNTKKQLRFSFDCAEEVFDGSTIAYSVLQLATYMGFKEIYLLGADCDYSGAVSHFDGTKATAAEQSAEAIRVIKGFYLYVPIAIWVVMFVIAACYQLDKVYDRMMRELIQREAGEKTASVQGEIQSMPLPEASGNRINVAIGRLYGSSGRKIAEDVAKALDCKVYDRQIICLMAEKFGMEKADLESVKQYLDSYNYEDSELTFSPYGHSSAGAAADYTGVQMFEVQSRIIRELSERRPGVFLGRCANYVLRGEPHTYSFFVYADDDYREKEGQEYYKGQSLGELKKRDQIRNEYYEKFTGIRRDDPHYYDMVINVSKTGAAGAAGLILDYIRNKEEEKGGNAS